MSKVQLTGMVRPNTTVLKEKSPSVNVAVPASSGVQVPDLGDGDGGAVRDRSLRAGGHRDRVLAVPVVAIA